jgi:hypothetical protein
MNGPRGRTHKGSRRNNGRVRWSAPTGVPCDCVARHLSSSASQIDGGVSQPGRSPRAPGSLAWARRQSDEARVTGGMHGVALLGSSGRAQDGSHPVPLYGFAGMLRFEVLLCAGQQTVSWASCAG